MKLNEIFEIYDLISRGVKNISSRKQSIIVRKNGFSSAISNGIIKVAFDTRRINQETEYNPRRGLQNYHRSEKFVSDNIALKLASFTKLKNVLGELKNEFGKEPEWQDSYSRVLLSALDKGLRTDQKDGDFSDAQPSLGSLDYLEELAYVRYRLSMDNLSSMSENELRKRLLDKDEILVSRGNYSPTREFNQSDVMKYSYDNLVDKMLSTMAQVMSSYKPPQAEDSLTSKLFDVKATKDSPDVERIVTISIKDKINDSLEKTSIEKVVSKVAEEKIEDEIVVE